MNHTHITQVQLKSIKIIFHFLRVRFAKTLVPPPPPERVNFGFLPNPGQETRVALTMADAMFKQRGIDAL